jgi:hypothetical protein
MKYLVLLAGDAGSGPAPGSEEFMAMLSDFGTVTDAMAAAGVLVDSGPLQDPATATTVRVRDGKRLVTDGPFAEIREQIGGYYVLQVANFDDAIDWAAQIPSARYGSVEVRPLMEMPT